MPTLLLIRHAHNDWIGTGIAGWTPGVHLNERGRLQAERLAQRLAVLPLEAVYSSPLERAQETAAPLAARLGLEVQTLAALGEVRFGDWTGKSLRELATLPEWSVFNSFRSCSRPPGGESTTEVQTRVLAELDRLRLVHRDRMIALVSHADVIRAALAHFAGIPLDLFHRLQIAPASVSIVDLRADRVQVVRVNDTGDFTAQ